MVLNRNKEPDKKNVFGETSDDHSHRQPPSRKDVRNGTCGVIFVLGCFVAYMIVPETLSRRARFFANTLMQWSAIFGVAIMMLAISCVRKNASNAPLPRWKTLRKLRLHSFATTLLLGQVIVNACLLIVSLLLEKGNVAMSSHLFNYWRSCSVAGGLICAASYILYARYMEGCYSSSLELSPMCPICGYSLIGAVSTICPECGHPVGPR